MHSLNRALDILRKKLQSSLSSDLRLPKIEALKLGEDDLIEIQVEMWK
jgi:hypothetical protein